MKLNPSLNLNQSPFAQPSASLKRGINRFHLFRIGLPMLAVLMLLVGPAKAAIYLHDGSTAVIYQGTGTLNLNNQSMTVTPGASVLVVCVGEGNANANYTPPATISWNGVTLTNAIYESAGTTSFFRECAIYYVYNPPPGTATFVSTTDPNNNSTGEWMAAYTLAGVNTSVPPLVGGVNAGQGYSASPATLTSFTLVGVTNNSVAAVAVALQGTGNNNALSVPGGLTSTSADNGDNNCTMTFGYISGLAAGADTLIDTCNTSGGKLDFIAAVFAPASQTLAQNDQWTGAASSTWDTTTANWINSLPSTLFANGDAAVFDNSASQFAVNVPAGVAPTSMTFSNTSAHAYTFGGAGSIGGGAVTVGAGSVTFNNANSFSGPITIGTGGSLALNAGVTYNGAVTIAAGGSFTVGDPAQLGGGTYGGNIVNNGAFTYNSSQNQTFSGVISGSGFFTNNGAGTIILRGASSFTSNVVINAGTVSDLNAENSQAPTVSGLGNPQIAGRTVTINNSGTVLSLDAAGGNDFGGGSTIVQMGIIINAGAQVQITQGNGTVGPITLNGGTLYAAPSAGYSQQYGSFEFGQDVTVGANTPPSTISSDGNYDFNLTVNTASGALRTFNVGANSVLTVSAQLGNASNTQNPSTLVKNGLGTMILMAANSSGALNNYSGGTIVSNGTLNVSSGGAGSGPVTVAGGTLGGSGTIVGNITVNSSGHTFPGNASVLTGNGTLTYNSGSEADFTLSTTYNGANDQIVLNGTGTLLSGGGAVVGIQASSAPLATAQDYVLINNLTGTNTPGIFSATPVWIGGSTPANAANFSVLTKATQVVLHYSPVSISAVVSPNPAAHNSTVTITVTATSTAGSIQSVTADVSALTNGVSPLSLISSNATTTYTNTFTVANFAAAGNDTIYITATDNAGSPNSVTIPVSLAVTPGAGAIEVWNGASSTNTWANGTNWASGVAPANGATVTFAGTVNTTANMESSYSVSSLTFSNNAASFNITNAANTLTLTGSVTNNSANAQTVNVPVLLSSGGVDTFNAASGNLAFSQAISGSDGVTTAGNGTNIFAGNNSYTGPTTVNGSLLLANFNAISSSANVTLNNNSRLLLRADTSGSFTPPLVTIQNTGGTWNFDLNTNLANVTTPTTLSLNDTLGFRAAADWTINVTGNTNYTLALGNITNNITAGNHNPYLNNNVVTSPTGPAVQISSLLAGYWGNYFNARGGGRITITGNITSVGASAGAYSVFVKDNTKLTLQGQSSISGDAFRYGVESGTLVLDNNSALVDRSTGTGQLQFYFILGAATNVYYGTQPFSPLAGLLLQVNNSSNAAVYLGDANYATGGLSVDASITNYVSDGDVGFANSGVFTIGGQNTSGINTYNNPIILGLTPNKGKSVTLVATAGGEVDFAGPILANGTDTTAGVTVGDAVHTGTVAFTGSNPNTYAGGTKVTNSILRIDGNGSGTGLGAVTVNNLGRLAGVGPVSGNVIVNSGGTVFPSSTNGNTHYVNENLSGNLTFSSGGSVTFNLGSSSGSGDKITVAQSSILIGTNAAVNIYATDSGHVLDTGSDYVLVDNLGANFTGVFTNKPTWLGTPPVNATNYSIVAAASQIRLHYNPAGITVAGSITNNPSFRGQTVTIYVTATGVPGIQSVVVDASSIGGSSSLTLNQVGSTSTYTRSVTIGGTIGAGVNTLLVTVTDSSAGHNQDVVPLLLTTTPGNEVWTGNGSDNQWLTGAELGGRTGSGNRG